MTAPMKPLRDGLVAATPLRRVGEPDSIAHAERPLVHEPVGGV